MANWVLGDRVPYRALSVCALLFAASACRRATATENADVNQDAERIFANVCSRCHGIDGKGGIAAGGANAPRNFCDSAFQANRSDDDLKAVIRKGKSAMPAFGEAFSESDLTGLVHKLRSFEPKK
ncbi:MAG TPA: cytochrome c [Polyangiaceae bacterium]